MNMIDPGRHLKIKVTIDKVWLIETLFGFTGTIGWLNPTVSATYGKKITLKTDIDDMQQVIRRCR